MSKICFYVGSMLNILFGFQIEVPFVGKRMECKFQKVGTFADVTGMGFKKRNSGCRCA